MINKIRIQQFAFGLAIVLASGASYAETTPAEQAAEMLARTQSVDLKCSYLNAADKDALSNLVARAELALANRESVDLTKATLQRGHMAGLAASCNANERQSVNSVLRVARQASAPQPSKSAHTMALAAPPVASDLAPSQPRQAVKPVVAPIEIVPAQMPMKIADKQPVKSTAPQINPVQVKQRAVKPVKTVRAHAVKKPMHAAVASGGLQHYGQMTEAYYLALRCSGSNRQVSGLYASILAAHGNLMQSHRAGEVSAVLHQAKSRAESESCL